MLSSMALLGVPISIKDQLDVAGRRQEGQLWVCPTLWPLWRGGHHLPLILLAEALWAKCHRAPHYQSMWRVALLTFVEFGH